ncbi:MAG: hypothetical protein WC196_06725 [Bacilli bacterium]
MEQEQVGRREDLCGRYSCAVRQDREGVSRYLAFPMACGSWRCPNCRRMKAEKYRVRMGAIRDGRKLYFMTLTYFHSMSPDEAWSTYNAAWNRLRTNAVKQFGEMNYIRVLECHKKSPYPHLHIITDRYLPPTKLGPAAVAAGFGYQIDSQEITTDQAFDYVRKYLTKEWTNEAGWLLRCKYRCRLITFSRGLLSPARRSGGWEMLLRGSDFQNCIDNILTDYQWQTDRRGGVSYVKEGLDTYEITVVWSDIPAGAVATPCVDTWQPDDWVPK